MLEFLFGYTCGIITIIFLAALNVRKQREKRDRKTRIDRIIEYGRKTNDRPEICKMQQPRKR